MAASCAATRLSALDGRARPVAHTGHRCRRRRAPSAAARGTLESSRSDSIPNVVDVVVIGAGVGGLTAAAMLAHFGQRVAVLEAHSRAGGCAHTWTRRVGERTFDFDVGTSLFFGLRDRPSDNPIAALLDLLGERVECVPCPDSKTALHFREGHFRTQIGSAAFAGAVEGMWGVTARREWQALQARCRELGADATAIHPMVVRFDNAIALTAALRSPGKLARSMAATRRLGDRKFGAVVREVVRDPNVLTFVDTLCKATSGIGLDDVVASYMVRTFNQLYQEGSRLEYPLGGGQGVVEAVVRGLRKKGGLLALNSRVAQVVVEGGTAKGVDIQGGRRVRARRAVVSNASVWDTAALLGGAGVSERESGGESDGAALSEDFAQSLTQMGTHDSFMHLHSAFEARAGEDLPFHTFFFDPDVVGNASSWPTVCIPSVLDPTAAPEGTHVMHAYFAEPYGAWEGLDPRGEAYRAQKAEREGRLWALAEAACPGVRGRQILGLTGSPLTHARFLSRHRGTYGPRNLQRYSGMPQATCPVPGLYVCGDSTWPGIGTPAASASGMWVANSLATPWQHWAALDALGL